jgi:hypothetical protein
MTEAKAKFEPSASDYALTAHAAAEAPAPELPYLPPMPKDRSIGIALVGAGGTRSAPRRLPRLWTERSHDLLA